MEINQKLYDMLYETIFTNGKYIISNVNSADFHAMTHMDTEILGMFCDQFSIHGEDLKQLLIYGYLTRLEMLKNRNYT